MTDNSAPELPRLTEDMIHAACIAHYGKARAARGGGPHGISLTVNDKDWTFAQGFRRMWSGIRKHLREKDGSGSAAEPADLCAADRGVTEKSDDWRNGFEVGWDERLKQERHNAAVAASRTPPTDNTALVEKLNAAHSYQDRPECVQRNLTVPVNMWVVSQAIAALASREAPPAVMVANAIKAGAAMIVKKNDRHYQVGNQGYSQFEDALEYAALRALGGSN